MGRRRAAALLAVPALVALLAGLAVALVGLVDRAGPAEAATCTINWTGAGGNGQWTTAANWDAGRVPATTDYACIPSGAPVVTLSAGSAVVLGVDASGAGLTITGGSLELTDATQSSSIRNLSFSGGTIWVDTGVSLLLSGAPQWTGGVLHGPGTATVLPGVTMTIAGSMQIVAGQTLVNQGTINWTAGSICFGGGAVIENQAVFNVNVDGQGMSNCVGGSAPRFHNAAGATLARNGGSGGIATISTPLDNDGTVKGNSGILRLGGGTLSGASGVFDVAAGATVEIYSGTWTFVAPAKEQGAGLFLFSGGTITGNLVITGTAEWSGGVMSGSGTTTVASGGTLNITGSMELISGHTLANQGTVTWTAGNVCFGSAAVIENTGVFNVNADGQSMSNCVGGTVPRFHNAAGGTLARNGSGAAATIAIPVDNDGTIKGNTGTLTLSGGTSAAGSSGVIDVASGATVEISNGTTTFVAPAKEQGAGRFLFSGGTITGNLVITGTAEWSGGVMSGSGTTTVASGGTLNITGSMQLISGHTLLNQGTIDWTAGNVCVGGAAVLDNAGLFIMAADGQSISNCVGGTAPTFHNRAGATLVRSSSATTATKVTIAIPFDNHGTIRVASGILTIQGDYTQPSDATLEVVLAGTTPGVQFGQLEVTGTATLGGTLSVLTAGGFTPSSGQTFQVVTCGTACNGTFATVTGGTVAYGAQSVVVNGTLAGAPAVTLNPTSVTFASTDVGTTSAVQTVTVQNTGTAPLVVGSVALSGPNAADFTRSSDTCSGATVAPSASCTVSLTFTPAAAGTRTASLDITDNAPGSPRSVPVSGTGAVP
ncbi:MAG TPA: choice-of-anchor D domain-containing protein, partial [Acidimicrobiales bacterium]|nr:choice-of-anchor D domain-containing protein [Acidimicrobiales bacterium]